MPPPPPATAAPFLPAADAADLWLCDAHYPALGWQVTMRRPADLFALD